MKLHPKGRERLEAGLVLHGMTHREFAAEIGWKSHGMVYQLIKGAKTSVSADSAVMIAKVLKVPLHDLFLTESSNSACQTERKAS